MNIAIFCGSSLGNTTTYQAQTKALGIQIAQRGWGLVYGGAKTGLMGTIADEVLACGAPVVGVIPEQLIESELAHPNLTRLIKVNTMHERKAIMATHADAFIALPGGIGTLEEIFEAWTWGQLSIHQKPCGFLNIDSYFNKLFDFFGHMVQHGFMSQTYVDMLQIHNDPGMLLENLASYSPPPAKWSRDPSSTTP